MQLGELEFERRYRAWSEAEERRPDDDYYRYAQADAEETAANEEASSDAAERRAWLVARRGEMQRDAQAIGRGVMYIAPPPMIGGGV